MATALEAFAGKRDRPLLVVHGGETCQLVESGSVVRCELSRSRRCSFNLDNDLRFDLVLWRHWRRLAQVLRWFRPDVLHFTGPSDVGQLGALLGRRQQIPMVGSWHSNIHEPVSRRLLTSVGGLDGRIRAILGPAVERNALAVTLLWYSLPGVVVAPSEEWRRLIESRAKKPTIVMTQGTDARSVIAACDLFYYAYDLAIAQASRGSRPLDGACATIPMKQSA
jgi:hypothetical protein